MSYYKDHHRDLEETGKTCRYVKNEYQKNSFANSMRAKHNVSVVSNPLGGGYVVNVEVIKDDEPTLSEKKGTKYSKYYDKLLSDGFVEFRTIHEHQARSYRGGIQRLYPVTTSIVLSSDEYIVTATLRASNQKLAS